MGEAFNKKVEDVENQFEKMNKDGNHEKFTKLPYFSNIGVDHIQGYTQYQTNKLFFIFTHSLKGRESGRIMITHALDQQHQEIRTPSGWNHPGGIQCVGSYLFVPCENDEQSIVCLYDLTNLQIEPLKIFKFSGHRASGLGIVDFYYNGHLHYLLLIGDGSSYYAYISLAPTDGDMTQLNFSGIGSFFFKSR